MKKHFYSLLLVVGAALSTPAHSAIITQDIFLDSIELTSFENPFDLTPGRIGSLSYDSDSCVADPLCLSFGIVSNVSVDLDIGGVPFDETMEVLGIGNTTANLSDLFDPTAGISGLFATLFDGVNSAAIVDRTFFVIDPLSEFLSGTVSFGEAIVGGDAIAVDEPSSLALVLPGILALLFARRRSGASAS